jgi:hypothetical protein
MTRDTARIIVAAGTVSLCLGVPALLYVAFTSERFVVDEVYGTRRTSYARSRECLGYRYWPHGRRRYTVHCVGIPFGSWDCRNDFYDDDGNLVDQNKSCE